MSMVIPLRSRSAAPSLPDTGASTETLQAFGDAHNALSVALHYLRQPGGNLAGARRKTGLALAALRRLDRAAGGAQ
ncbi:MAG: hypothetical protein BGO13_00245 [Burkholderiales bacterium 66-5]|nr:MAG: hypothetical protein BGO13_00245 [Burkholderiales bacterium 66-5]